MNCRTCKFNHNMMCSNPKNYQPKQRQYMRVKPFSRRFYPERPAWCKGYEQVSDLYCLTCDEHLQPLIAHDSKAYHWRTAHYEYWEGGIDEVCFGPFTQCQPPELAEDVWDWIFANEPPETLTAF